MDSAIKGQVSNSWQSPLQGLDTKNMKETWRITKRLTKGNNIITPLTIYGKRKPTHLSRI
jgi:hypothetical protein